MTFIYSLFAFFVTIPGLIAVLITLAFFDYKEFRGWAGTLFVFAGLLWWWVYRPSWEVIGFVTLSWAASGFCWAAGRWRRHCAESLKHTRENMARYTNMNAPGDHLLSVAMNPLRYKSRISYWALFWPISLLGCIGEDLFKVIEKLVTGLLKGLFRSTSEKYAKQAQKEWEEFQKKKDQEKD